MWKKRQAPVTMNQQWNEGGEGGKTLEDAHPCKTMLTVNVCHCEGCDTFQSKSTWNPREGKNEPNPCIGTCSQTYKEY